MQITSPWLAASFAADRDIMDIIKKSLHEKRKQQDKQHKQEYLESDHVYEERFVSSNLPTGAKKIQVSGRFAWHLNEALKVKYRNAIIKEIDDGVGMGQTTVRMTRWYLTEDPIDVNNMFDELSVVS